MSHSTMLGRCLPVALWVWVVSGVMPTLAVAQSEARASTLSAIQTFWQQSRWQLLQRSVFEERQYLNGGRSNGGRNAGLPRSLRSDYAKEWGYAAMANLESAFTPGLLGLGLDAHVYAGWNLAGDDKRVGKIRMLPVDAQGYAQSHLVRGGVALKFKVGQTVLRLGEQRAKSPIFSSSDSRLLPETMRGWHLTSNDISDWTLHLGQYRGSTDRNSRSTNNALTVNYLSPTSRRGKTFDLAGAQWQAWNNAGQGERHSLTLSAWQGRLKNTWHTSYLGANYTLRVSSQQSLGLDAQVYHSRNTGRAWAGRIRNTTTSLFGRWQTGAHTFGLGWQKVASDTPFDYVTRGAIWLGNAAQLSDFNAPHEQSWQLRYELDAGTLAPALAGLRMGLAHIRGSGIDGTRMPTNSGYTWLGYGRGGRHWERDMWLRYTVANGRAKGLAILLRYGEHRANRAQAELDTRQIRLSVEYPLGG